MSTQAFPASDIPRLSSIDYWTALIPDMAVTEYPFQDRKPELDTGSINPARYVEQMRLEGYVNLEGVLPGARMERMAQVILRLAEEGLPPVFCFVYDDFWQIFRDIAPVMSPIIGEDYMLSLNRWAWNIPPSEEYCGFRPHRDMVGDEFPGLRDDGLPMITTAWIALRDVSASNACIYVLPQNRDPNVPDNLMKMGVPYKHLQDIRALPARAGSIMSWNSNVLHWGGRGSSWIDTPRINIGCYLMRAEGSTLTGVKTDPSQPVTLDFRLGAIATVMARYDADTITDDSVAPELISYFARYRKCAPGEWRFPQPAGAAEAPEV